MPFADRNKPPSADHEWVPFKKAAPGGSAGYWRLKPGVAEARKAAKAAAKASAPAGAAEAPKVTKPAPKAPDAPASKPAAPEGIGAGVVVAIVGSIVVAGVAVGAWLVHRNRRTFQPAGNVVPLRRVG